MESVFKILFVGGWPHARCLTMHWSVHRPANDFNVLNHLLQVIHSLLTGVFYIVGGYFSVPPRNVWTFLIPCLGSGFLGSFLGANDLVHFHEAPTVRGVVNLLVKSRALAERTGATPHGVSSEHRKGEANHS